MENESISTVSTEADSQKNKTPEPKRRVGFFVAVLVISIFLSSFFGAVFGFMASSIGQKFLGMPFSKFLGVLDIKNPQDKEVIKQQVIEEDSAVIDVVEKTSPAVVSIVISRDVPRVRNGFPMNPFFDIPDFFEDPFGSDGTQEPGPNGDNGTQKQKIGGGTGFFITEDGMIVTNKHVVSDQTADYTVITSDSQERPAKVLARDPINDIAVIKIEGSGYPTLNLGDSSGLKIGQTVVAIGNSLGEFSNTVSKGIISGLKRNVTAGGSFGQTEKLSNIIQTDAAINPGNSGGPLLDINGDVIGVNVAVAQGAENIGFAIPSNQIKKITQQVRTTGKISTPFLGVRYVPIDKTIQEENNLPYNYGILVARGSRITDFAVIPGSPADKAGITENDIILEVNGVKIDDNSSLTDLLSEQGVGTEIILKVWHKGETKDVKVKLEERK